MIDTRANERFAVISEFGSRLPLYILSSSPPPVHMSSPRQQSARLARQPASYRPLRRRRHYIELVRCIQRDARVRRTIVNKIVRRTDDEPPLRGLYRANDDAIVFATAVRVHCYAR